MRRTLTMLVTGLIALLVPATAAYAAPAYPAPATCVDTANALSAGTCARITSVLKADEKAGPDRDQIAVAVVPTTGEASIEDWSTGLFNDWGVGQKGKDNGVLLVVAMQDRTLRIATGDGVRTRLSDGQASEIIGGTITPLLKLGRTDDAVLAGLDGIRTALGHDVTTTPLAAPGVTDGLNDGTPLFDEPTTEDDDSSSSSNGAWIWVLLLIGLGVAGWLSSLFRDSSGGDHSDDDSYSRRRSYRSFSSGSSRRSSSSSSRRSSGGFGGGRSSGGGASGRW